LEKLYQDNPYNTLSGLILDRFGRIPQTGERFKWADISLEIADMDGARIDKVIVNKTESEDSGV
jgi:putative hemolysin